MLSHTSVKRTYPNYFFLSVCCFYCPKEKWLTFALNTPPYRCFVAFLFQWNSGNVNVILELVSFISWSDKGRMLSLWKENLARSKWQKILWSIVFINTVTRFRSWSDKPKVLFQWSWNVISRQHQMEHLFLLTGKKFSVPVRLVRFTIFFFRINPFQPSFTFYIETTHFICISNQMTGFIWNATSG